LPGTTDQNIPAIAPARGPGSLALVGLVCDDVDTIDFEECADVDDDGEAPITFEITKVYPSNVAPAATFVANGAQLLKCADGATCDAADNGNGTKDGWVAVQVTGGGVNEVVQVKATDESGDFRMVKIIFVDTIFAVSPLNASSALSSTLISYNCPDVGAVPEIDADWQDWLLDLYGFYFQFDHDGVAANNQQISEFAPKDGELFYKCGGDTGSPVDDRVNFETDKAILTVEEPADIAQSLPPESVYPTCDAGDSVDVLDSPSWELANSGGQLCDLDFAPNGVVTYGLLGTGDVGVASVTAQQSGGGGVLRTINVTFAGAAAMSLFIDAPASVGLLGADFNVLIVDQDGRPIDGETVECSVSPTGGALVIIPQTGTSDGNGNVKFNLIPTGASVVGGEELTITCFLDSNPDVKATDMVTLSTTPQLESVALVEGCNPIAATWADGTAIATVAGAVAPAEALDAIWKFDPATGTWQGFSPSAPAAVNDLTKVDRLDAVFVCVSAAATIGRPVI
jgi:hypothetical protein